MQAISNNLTKFYNIQYCILTLPLISSCFPILFSSSPNFLVYLYPFLFTVFESYLKFFLEQGTL